MKYTAFLFLLVDVIATIVFASLMSVNRLSLIGKIIYVLLIVFFLIFNRAYWRYELKKNDNNRTFLIEYIDYFMENDFNAFQYIESLRWFSMEVRKIYLEKSEKHDDVKNLINKLHLIVSPKKQGLCIATFHRDLFITICHNITKTLDAEHLDEESLKIVEKMKLKDIEPMTTAKFVSCMICETPFMYGFIVIASVLGCGLISTNIKEFFGNFLISVPSQVVMILAYFNIVKDKYNQ